MSRWHHIEAPHRLPDTITLPGSKSISHRALLLAHHCSEPPHLKGLLRSADTLATEAGVKSLGSKVPVDCQNSGTTLRLLIGQAALQGRPTQFTGDASLARRTCAPLLQSLAEAGVRVESRGGYLPIQIQGPLKAGRLIIDGRLSSQFISSLLLALPFAEGDSEVVCEGFVPSERYVDLTLDCAKHFGLVIERTSSGYRIPGNQRAQSHDLWVEGDWSSAALAVAYAMASKRAVTLKNLRADSAQADRRILQLLERFGSSYRWLSQDFVIEPGGFQPVDCIDLQSEPDLLPPVAVLASLSPGATTIRCSPGIQHKETNRLVVMAKALSDCGLQVDVSGNDLIVVGGQAKSSRLNCQSDHRIHMALCGLAVTVPGGLILDSAEAVNVSWPGFHEALGLRLSQ